MKNNLIFLLDQNYPEVNDFFDSPACNDSSQKWVNCFFPYNWHTDCTHSKSLNISIGRFQRCFEHGAMTSTQIRLRNLSSFF